MKTFFTQGNIRDVLQFLQDFDFNKIFTLLHFYVQLLCPSDGTLNGARGKDNNPSGTQKTVSLDFDITTLLHQLVSDARETTRFQNLSHLT